MSKVTNNRLEKQKDVPVAESERGSRRGVGRRGGRGPLGRQHLHFILSETGTYFGGGGRYRQRRNKIDFMF